MPGDGSFLFKITMKNLFQQQPLFLQVNHQNFLTKPIKILLWKFIIILSVDVMITSLILSLKHNRLWMILKLYKLCICKLGHTVSDSWHNNMRDTEYKTLKYKDDR